MKVNHYLLGFVLLVAGALPVSSQVSNDNEDGVNKIETRSGIYDFVPGQVLVKFKDESPMKIRRTQGVFRSAGNSKVDAVLKEFGVETMDKLLPNEQPKPKSLRRRAKAFNGQDVIESDLSQLYILNTSSPRPDSTLMLVDKLKELGEVEFAEPNYKVYMMGQTGTTSMLSVKTDQSVLRRAYSTEVTGNTICSNPEQNPLYNQQWGIPFMKINELWSKPLVNKKRPVIAILDTGVDITHPDLADNIWTNTKEAEGEADYDNDGNGFKSDVHGWDFINNTADIRDYNSHGTHVAGIAAACNNEIGIVGANPQALIMPITVMQSDGTGDVATIVKGVDYAVTNGATIINMSFGSYNNSNVLRTALAKAYQTAVLTAAAGNDGLSIYEECGPTRGPMFPAAYEFVFGVMATEEDGSLAIFSNVDSDGSTFSQPYKDMWGDKGYGGVNYELKAPGVNIISAVPNGNYKRLNGTSMSAPLVAGAISVLQMLKDYDTQEILWGDIIHTTDFLKAYEVTERPAMLELISLEWDDSQDGGNGDNMFDAGETLRLYPLFKTTWGEAKNIKFNLAVAAYDDETLVDILSQNVDFGWTLSNYGRQISKNPLLIKIADNVADNRHIRLILTATCDNNLQDISYEFPIVVNNVVKIGGIISENMTLTADKNYLVTKNLVVDQGCTLTVEPGTTLKFMSGVGLRNVGTLIMNGEPGRMITLTHADQQGYWNCPAGRERYQSSYTGWEYLDTLSYCRIEYSTWPTAINLKNCILSHTNQLSGFKDKQSHYRTNITEIDYFGQQLLDCKFDKMNIVNNHLYWLPIWGQFGDSNYFNNLGTMTDIYTNQKPEWLYSNNGSGLVGTYHSDTPSYMGTSREDIANSMIQDIDYGYGYFNVDLSNMLKEPVKDAHGIVWKVLVDGYDAQDEYEQLPPLGVGIHKFEVYFNRPMNKQKIPHVSFGIREPYTQNSVSENGTWNNEGTIYTAYHTITGKTQSNGLNLIYVSEAEDDEFFEIPYEKSRFFINIQSAGSLATGFMGESGLGKVTLTWNNENNDITDAMGYNVYRYTVDAEGKADTTCINKEIVDIEDTEYIDYDVVPGTTYYYYYKVLSTDLKEYDISNVVSVTPQTSSLGDANGSGDVDVADVITTVNFAAGMEPKPFIFEAADMNSDEMIDILDVIGIIQKILNPTATAPVMVENVATYTVEDGVLYVDSPVALAGVQVQMVASPQGDEFEVAADLDGFEHVSAWLSDNDYLFMAYNMNGKTLSAGKHALLTIGDAQIASIRLSNAMGGNVPAVEGETTNIEQVLTGAANTAGIYNLHGQRLALSADQLSALPKGVYIVDGKKVIKWK